MSATAVRSPARPEQPATSGPRRRRRRRAGAALLASLALLAGLVLAARDPAPAPPPTVPAPAADVTGTYRLDDGSPLLLWGDGHGLRYELDGTVVFLRAAGIDRLRDASGEETLDVLRDRAGSVTGLRLERPGEAPALAVRDDPYAEDAMRFGSDGARLSGSLLVPHGPGPHPAVVVVHGAEAGTRENYRLLAAHLARAGVAALIYDKRGTGASTGDLAGATFDDLAGDALAGIATLAADDRIDAGRIGLAGMSQGGWVVAKAAAGNGDVAFVVALSPSGFSPADQQAWLQGNMLAVRGFDTRWMRAADRVSRMLYSSLDLVDAGIMPPSPHVPGFWFHALEPHLDTAALWEGVGQPVLGLWGATDCQVPARDSARRIGRALRRGGNADVTLLVVPGADHGFTITGPCAHETGMADHGRMEYAGEYLRLPARWIASLGERPAPDGRGGIGGGDPEGGSAPTPAPLAWHLATPAPAPWYGSLAAQALWLALLLGAFAAAGGRWAAAAVAGRISGRRDRAARSDHLAGAAALAGLLATVTGAAAVVEVAMLGATHAAFLVGGPTVGGTSVLLAAAGTLTGLTLALAVAAVAVAVRDRAGRHARHTPGAGPVGRRVALVAAGVAALVAWAAYWGLVPVLWG